MKNTVLILLLVVTINTNAQTKPTSLKDLLYSGKLKADSTGMIRKGDDLSLRIETSTKAVEPEAQKIVPVNRDASTVAPLLDTSATDAEVTDSATTSATDVKAPATPVKTNTKIWKEYTDSLVSTLKAEVLNSKKVKKETYFLTVDYEINTDGSLNIMNVISTPENAYIQSEVKNRIELTAPQLAPVLDSNKQPRKVKRKHNFSITKE
jgi:hypothetical protein